MAAFCEEISNIMSLLDIIHPFNKNTQNYVPTAPIGCESIVTVNSLALDRRQTLISTWWFHSPRDAWASRPQPQHNWHKSYSLILSVHGTWYMDGIRTPHWFPVLKCSVIICMLFIPSVHISGSTTPKIDVICDIWQTFMTSEVRRLSGEDIDLQSMADFLGAYYTIHISVQEILITLIGLSLHFTQLQRFWRFPTNRIMLPMIFPKINMGQLIAAKFHIYTSLNWATIA